MILVQRYSLFIVIAIGELRLDDVSRVGARELEIESSQQIEFL